MERVETSSFKYVVGPLVGYGNMEKIEGGQCREGDLNHKSNNAKTQITLEFRGKTFAVSFNGN